MNKIIKDMIDNMINKDLSNYAHGRARLSHQYVRPNGHRDLPNGINSIKNNIVNKLYITIQRYKSYILLV